MRDRLTFGESLVLLIVLVVLSFIHATVFGWILYPFVGHNVWEMAATYTLYNVVAVTIIIVFGFIGVDRRK